MFFIPFVPMIQFSLSYNCPCKILTQLLVIKQYNYLSNRIHSWNSARETMSLVQQVPKRPMPMTPEMIPVVYASPTAISFPVCGLTLVASACVLIKLVGLSNGGLTFTGATFLISNRQLTSATPAAAQNRTISVLLRSLYSITTLCDTGLLACYCILGYLRM